MKKITLITLVIITVFVAGCADAQTLPTPTPTKTPTPIAPATTVHAIPTMNVEEPVALVTEAPTTPTAAPTDMPTATTIPVVTATSEPTNTATTASTPTATATSTPEATVTPTSTPTITPTPAPQVRAAGKKVNVRRGPGTIFPVMAVLHDGETAPVVARGPNDWLQIDVKGRAGWVYSGVVETIGPVGELAMAENIPTPPPTPTPVPPTATPAPAGPQLPPKQDVVHLTKDTQFPVRANRFMGWGYEIVDASEKWDIVMYRDVLGYVLHQFYGDALYKQHPHGMKITFIDCQPAYVDGLGNVPCLGEQAPVPIFNEDRSLTIFFSDGIGSDVGMGCGVPGTNYYDPQECFISLGPVDAGYLTDLAVTASILADKSRMDFTAYDTPNLAQAPFTPHLGIAHKDEATQQWRWKDPFIRIVPQQP